MPGILSTPEVPFVVGHSHTCTDINFLLLVGWLVAWVAEEIATRRPHNIWLAICTPQYLPQLWRLCSHRWCSILDGDLKAFSAQQRCWFFHANASSDKLAVFMTNNPSLGKNYFVDVCTSLTRNFVIGQAQPGPDHWRRQLLWYLHEAVQWRNRWTVQNTQQWIDLHRDRRQILPEGWWIFSRPAERN